MEIVYFCVILRRNSFSITERRGFHLSYHGEKPAASGSYLKLLAFENSQCLARTYSFMFKNFNTSLWMNFTSSLSLQNRFHRFDLEMPPKGGKTCICETLISWIFVKRFDGKKSPWSLFIVLFHTVFSKNVGFTKFFPKRISVISTLWFASQSLAM